MEHATAKPRYTVIIQWSDEDQCYVVSLPEWGPYAKTHGKNYEEAARNAQEVLELLMSDENGKPANLPAAKLFQYPGANVVELPLPRLDPKRLDQTTKVAKESKRRQTA